MPQISVSIPPPLRVAGGILPTSVTAVRVLGHGRAAEARLVEVESDASGRELCVEKVFRPGLLTRSIYRASFQAPFAYQDSADAILAAFYRRRIAAAIVQARAPEAAVAKPLYVRWDEESQAMVLASEYIQGRGIIPQEADPWMTRRWFATRLGKGSLAPPAPREEIDDLLGLMTKLEDLLVDCGLTGSGWQVCKRAMVSTANLLRTDQGYVVIDLESGIPSVLVPRYLREGLRLGSLPLFDDLDAGRLQGWIEQHHGELRAALPPNELRQLEADVPRLIEHTQRWKLSEPAIGRNPTRWLTPEFRASYRNRVLDSWQRRGIADAERVENLRAGETRLRTDPVYWLGWIPGRVGRFSQRLVANQGYRAKVNRWLSDAEYRRDQIAEYAATAYREWEAEGRVGPQTQTETQAQAKSEPRPMAGVRFVAHSLAAKLLPAGLHRWCVDSRHRRNSLAQLKQFCIDGRFQSQLGRSMILSRVNSWDRDQRLTSQAAATLVQELDAPAVAEYVRGFGLHVGLKLLTPLALSLKVGGAAASLASGNPFYFLLTLMLLPILRTAVTLWRMVATQSPFADYRDALLVGILPVVGSLAYPVQMHAKFPVLSNFLLRDFAARCGRWLPIYGGKDSRTEMTAIKSVNVLAEGIELWSVAVDSGRQLVAPSARMLPARMLPDRKRPDRLAAERSVPDDARSRPILWPFDGWDRVSRRPQELPGDVPENAIDSTDAMPAHSPRRHRKTA